jgi:hypothetical protein
MTKASDTKQGYVRCERCGKQIPEQSAIEEEGQLLCGECLVAEVNRDVSKTEAEAEHQRHQEHRAQREQIRKQQRRRTLIILGGCVAVLLIALVLNYMSREEPVPTRKIDSVEHPELVRSMLTIGIYKYQKEHERPPESLKKLIPDYVDGTLSGAFELFEYAVVEDNYTLEIRKPSATASEVTPEEDVRTNGVRRDEL